MLLRETGSSKGARGRILATVLSHSFYYKAAPPDLTAKSFTVIPIAIESDVAGAGWSPDRRVLADGAGPC